jgi:hypothetical protein
MSNGTRSGLDKWFTDLFIVAILISVFCNGLCLIPLILNLIGYFTCKDPTAKKNAMICLIISGVLIVIGIVANLVFGLGGALLNR